jgi:hypothetical protein
MAKKKAAKKAAPKTGGSKGTKKASRKGTKKKSAKKKTVLGRMSDMMESAGEGIASAAKYVTPKGMMGGRGKKKGGSRKK